MSQTVLAFQVICNLLTVRIDRLDVLVPHEILIGRRVVDESFEVIRGETRRLQLGVGGEDLRVMIRVVLGERDKADDECHHGDADGARDDQRSWRPMNGTGWLRPPIPLTVPRRRRFSRGRIAGTPRLPLRVAPGVRCTAVRAEPSERQLRTALSAVL